MSTMMRFALPMLAAAGTAYAASSCSASATLTIQNSGDATAIAGCSVFTGSIAIATQAAGDIVINGVQNITGNLVADGASNMTTLSGDKLTKIGGDFELISARGLNSISFPQLSEVGTIKWTTVPGLSSLDLQVKKADGITIDDSNLDGLDTISLDIVDNILIVNNGQLKAFEMPLTNVTGSFTLQGNSQDMVIKLLSLEGADSITVVAASSLEVPALTTLGTSLNLRLNTFESFTAPNLTKVGNSIVVNDNTQLTNLSFPILTAVSKALQIANNTLLNKIDGLPKLKTIGADLDFHGNFSEVALPSLTDVSGTFNIQSTGDIQSTCDEKFKPLSVNGGTGRIRGKYTCVGEVANPGGLDSNPTKTGGGSSKTNAASPLNVQNYGALSFAGLAAAFFF